MGWGGGLWPQMVFLEFTMNKPMEYGISKEQAREVAPPRDTEPPNRPSRVLHDPRIRPARAHAHAADGRGGPAG